MSTGCRLPRTTWLLTIRGFRGPHAPLFWPLRVAGTPVVQKNTHIYKYKFLNIRGSIKPSAFPLSQKVHWSWAWKFQGKGVLLLNLEDWLGVCDNGWAGNLFHIEGKTQKHNRNEYKVSETCKDSQNSKTLHVSPGNIVPKANVSVLIISVCFVLDILGSSGKDKKKKDIVMRIIIKTAL